MARMGNMEDTVADAEFFAAITAAGPRSIITGAVNFVRDYHTPWLNEPSELLEILHHDKGACQSIG